MDMDSGPPQRTDSGYASDDGEEVFLLPRDARAAVGGPGGPGGWADRLSALVGGGRVMLPPDGDGGQPSKWALWGARARRARDAVRAAEGFEFWAFVLSTSALPFAAYTATGDALGWTDRRKKTPADWAHDFVGCLMWCSFLFCVRGRKARTSLTTVAATLVTSLAWGFASELGMFRHSLADVHRWGAAMWAAVGLAIAGTLVGGYLHVSYAWRHGRMFSVVGRPLILGAVFFLSTVSVAAAQNSVRGSPQATIHFHHYQLAFLLATACIAPAWWSRLCLGVCLGLFTHGIAAYGADNVLDQNWAKPNCGGGAWSCKCARVACSCAAGGLLAG
ncbi:hypothetical protein DFJ74DRAFT_708302 [Hyaloraphidium curvatum]|nr:hypothetical protein DFJ74DRAFT_708302 [Hyaloraphidium curvatum]